MASYKIQNFSGGYNLGREENALAPNETRNAQNVDISHGDLRTTSGFAKYTAAAVAAPVTRLMKFYKNNLTTGAVTSYLIAATASTLSYWGGSSWTSIATGLTNGNWDYIGYQTGETDIVIMGNGADEMKKWDGTTFANLGGTPPKMKSITLHSERVWGIGNVASPSSVYYSDDLNPENWTGGEDAAGEIFIPTWDGGVCIGISNIFSDVVIFKTNNIFRILGTYPAVYEVKQVYSTVGAIAERTIVSAADRAFFLTKDGLMYYNGVSVYPLLESKLKDLVINPSYASTAVSIIYKNKLYCAIPEGTATSNTTVIVYDLIQNNVMLLRGLTVTDFIEFDDKLLFANSTGYVYQLFSGTTFDGTAISAFYETPFSDLGSKNTVKSIDTLYFYASGTGSLQVDLTLDSKTKTKTVTLASGGKMHTIPFSLEGRKLKLKFTNVTGSDFIVSSPEITLEADAD